MPPQKTDRLIQGFIECFRLLRPKQKKEYGIVVAFRTAAAILDMLGLAAIIPVISVLVDYESAINGQRIGQLYELLGSPGEQGLLIALVVFAVALIWLNGLSVALATFTSQRYLKRVSADLSTRVYQQYMQNPIDQFYGRTSSEFARNVNGVSERVAQGVIGNSSNIIAKAFQVLFILSILTIVNYKATLILVAVVLGSYISIFLTIRTKLAHMSTERMKEGKEVQQLITGSYRAYRSIIINGLLGAFEKHFNELKSNASRRAADMEIIASTPKQLIEVIGLSLLIFSSYFIGRTAENSHEFVSIMALFGIAAYRLLPAAQQIYHGINRYITALTAYRLVASEWQLLPAPMPKPGKDNLTEPQRPQTLSLNNICYSHGSNKTLHNVSAQLELRGFIQIAGESGAGKSTLMDILTGLRTPDSGEILVDGKPFADIGQQEWWKMISYQSQDDYIFHGSLGENIALGRQSLDTEKLNQVANICELHTLNREGKFIPEQQVSEGGTNLSGGQKNRLLLARALYKNSHIVFLDEAFSALDLATSQRIIEKISQEFAHRCFVVISHRAAEFTHNTAQIQLSQSASLPTNIVSDKPA